ncbi:MAG: hypothetical protein H0T89_02185 [Deltaproteobacteria bacterium]|nr:hypothetical protein [Deltaproteobacteria bacterium]MDQ3301341.1 hypothetical protein [Myxococcota bacterium]
MDDDDTELTPFLQVEDDESEFAVGTLDGETVRVIHHRLGTEGDWPPPPREPSEPCLPPTRNAAFHQVVKRPDTAS